MPKGMKFVRISNTQQNSKNIYTTTGLIGKKDIGLTQEQTAIKIALYHIS
jgi:hypothetical protein